MPRSELDAGAIEREALDLRPAAGGDQHVRAADAAPDAVDKHLRAHAARTHRQLLDHRSLDDLHAIGEQPCAQVIDQLRILVR
jgi:hypothetical protein